MEVNALAVTKTMAEHGAQRLIHGHTHHPGRHTLPNGGERWVLGPWEDEASLLACSPDGCRLESWAL